MCCCFLLGLYAVIYYVDDLIILALFSFIYAQLFQNNSRIASANKIPKIIYYLSSSLTSLYNAVDFIQHSVSKSHCRKILDNSTGISISALMGNICGLTLFEMDTYFVIFIAMLTYSVFGICHAVVTCIERYITYVLIT